METKVIKTEDGASIAISKARVLINGKPALPEVGISIECENGEANISLTPKEAISFVMAILNVTQELDLF